MHVLIEPLVRQFVADNFLFREGAEGLSNDESLIAGGVIDSTGILELVSFIEQTFDIEIADEELVPDNLDSIGQITGFVRSKMGAHPFSAGVEANHAG